VAQKPFALDAEFALKTRGLNLGSGSALNHVILCQGMEPLKIKDQ
jgi:hypothetical protein